MEARHLREVFAAQGGDVAAAAAALGMPLSTLYYKLAKFGIARMGRGGRR